MERYRHLFWLMGIFSFPYFVVLGVRNYLYLGHDHWCSGHVMVLAQSYSNADFATPYWLPMENPVGSTGMWTPYTGWPPLFSLSLGLIFAISGPNLIVARLVAAACTTGSTMLVMALCWRVTRSVWATLAAGLFFVGQMSIGFYCCFVNFETPGLTWSLLLLWLHPVLLWDRKPAMVGLYTLLTIISALLSWHCYLVAPACALALALCDWSTFRSHWGKLLAPLLAAALTGLALLILYKIGDAQFQPNDERTVEGRFSLRLGNAASWRNLRVYFNNYSQEYGPVSMGFLAAGLACYLLRRPAQISDETHPDLRGRFYLHALWLFPVCWTLFLPQMMGHDFQRIFFVPFLAVAMPALLYRLLQQLPATWGRHLTEGAVLLFLLGIAQLSADGVLNSGRKRVESDQEMAKDIAELTTPNTVVAIDSGDKGTWWSLQRPMVMLHQLPRVQDRDHVVATGMPGPEGVAKEYVPVRHNERHRYIIWKKKTTP